MRLLAQSILGHATHTKHKTIFSEIRLKTLEPTTVQISKNSYRRTKMTTKTKQKLLLRSGANLPSPAVF